MTETKELYRTGDNVLDRYLQSIADRLDKLEGLRSNPAFYSETFEFPVGLEESKLFTSGTENASFEDYDSASVDHNTTTNYEADEHIDWTDGPVGKDMDLASGGSYLLIRRVRQAAEPTPTAGELIIWSDSDDDKVYLVYEDADAGTVKIELT